MEESWQSSTKKGQVTFHGLPYNDTYFAALLEKLKAVIIEKRPEMARKRMLFHHDNASSYTSHIVREKSDKLQFQIVPLPPYSPDLAPTSNYSRSSSYSLLQTNLSRAKKLFCCNGPAFWQPRTDHYKTDIMAIQHRLLLFHSEKLRRNIARILGVSRWLVPKSIARF